MYFQYYNKNIDKRVRQLKLVAAIFLGLGLIIASTFASYFSQLYFQANAYNQAQRAATELTPAAKTLYYDQCISGKETIAVDYENDTHWTFMYRFNMIVYTMLSGMLFCSFGGLVYSKLFQLTLSCLQIAGIFHLAAIILVAVFRFNMVGTACSENDVVYDGEEGNSWESDSSTVLALMNAQMALFIPFCACTCVGYFKNGQRPASKGMIEDEDDDDFQRPHY